MSKGIKGFQKGHPKLGGRKVGSQNKFTGLKQAFVEAFKEIGAAKGLIEWIRKSNENQKIFYTLVARMLPAEMKEKVDVSADAKLNFIFAEYGAVWDPESQARDRRPPEMTDEALDAEIARLKKAEGEKHDNAGRAAKGKEAKAKS